jgi:transcriptional regulator with XRE-family HTH domain
MKHLLNYLRTFRRRLGLSQEEVAYLLGSRGPGKASRYERFHRQPNVETVFAYEIIFCRPVRELFAGTYDGVMAKVRQRAIRLMAKVTDHPRSAALVQTLKRLTADE